VACSEPHVGELVEKVLRHRMGDDAVLEIRRVADGVGCLQDIEMRRPDAVVLHGSLDGMSPAEILDAWRRSHPDERLPAIVLSASYGRDVPAGLACRVVNLPFDNAALADVIERELES
jgi:CheY-like chemotaxis protein